MAVTVPDRFHADTIGREGPGAGAWLGRLPRRVERLCAQWELVVDGPTAHGYTAIVVPVAAAAGPAVLKLSWPGPETGREHLALATWAGRGAARLLAAEDTDEAPVLLLERLHAGRDLGAVDEVTACEVIGALHRELAVPPPAGLLTLHEGVDPSRAASEWARVGEPVPRRVLDRALEWWGTTDDAETVLLHGDLHHVNVLAADRAPWLAIDPQPRVGDAASGLLPLLRNRFDVIRGAADPRRELWARLRRACAAGGFAPERAAGWAQARAVLDLLWMLTLPDPDGGAVLSADVRDIAEWLA